MKILLSSILPTIKILTVCEVSILFLILFEHLRLQLKMFLRQGKLEKKIVIQYYYVYMFYEIKKFAICFRIFFLFEKTWLRKIEQIYART